MTPTTPLVVVAALFAAGTAVAEVARDGSVKPDRPALVLAPSAFASEAGLGAGCWARLYAAKAFSGEALTLVGPLEVDYVKPDWGFEWEPRYGSVAVGPKATLTLYDDTRLRDKVAVYEGAQRIADLDSRMGIFRTVRSMKVTCSSP